MDFTSMNFGDLLFALNCDQLKNEIKWICLTWEAVEMVDNTTKYF